VTDSALPIHEAIWEATEGAYGPGLLSEVTGEGGSAHDDTVLIGGDGRVQIAYCHGHDVSHSWAVSMMDLLAYDKAVGYNVIGGAPFRVHCSGPHGLVEGRHMAVAHFLDHTPHEWLFWVDTDMGFKPDALDRLFEAADPIERPVVGGLCFAAKQSGPDGSGGFRLTPIPTIFGLAKDPQGHIGFVNRSVYPRDSLIQVAGTGSAFILIHRTVLEDIRLKHGDEWYSQVSYENKKLISEDLSFCWRVGDAERPLWVHTGVKTTHHKDIWIGEQDYEMPPVDAVFKTVNPEFPPMPMDES
jgi:hypothetical protein